jgi:glycosyltransferase involved in cell wall biosynthesis
MTFPHMPALESHTAIPNTVALRGRKSTQESTVFADRTIPATQAQLSILAPVRYLWHFNSPKKSRHNVSVRTFVPLNYVSKKIEGVTVFNPLPLKRFDLIHAFNRIPFSTLPYVIGFESHLPRGFGIETSLLFRYMTERLVSDKCRAIIAISDFARRTFLRAHDRSPCLSELSGKLHVRLPNLVTPAIDDICPSISDNQIRVLFVGNHFARKGGCVALRIAELAFQRKLPLRLDIVSQFQIGRASWADPLDDSYFDQFRKLFTLPTVHNHGSLPNSDVLTLLREAHFNLLTTFSDTFGFSAMEAMANYCPVIATRQGALPEFIYDGVNGVVLDIETDDFGEWIHLGDDRHSAAFAKLHRDEVERLAQSAFRSILMLAAHPQAYSAMRESARSTAIQLFGADDANHYWDTLYDRAVQGVVLS